MMKPHQDTQWVKLGFKKYFLGEEEIKMSEIKNLLSWDEFDVYGLFTRAAVQKYLTSQFPLHQFREEESV